MGRKGKRRADKGRGEEGWEKGEEGIEG